MENNTNIKVSINGDVTITINGVERKFDNSFAVDIFVELIEQQVEHIKTHSDKTRLNVIGLCRAVNVIEDVINDNFDIYEDY